MYKWYWNSWLSMDKKMNVEQYLVPYIKINSKGILDLNEKPTTATLLEENIEENLCNFGLAQDFLGTTVKARSVKD